jgi:hypothetical protein
MEGHYQSAVQEYQATSEPYRIANGFLGMLFKFLVDDYMTNELPGQLAGLSVRTEVPFWDEYVIIDSLTWDLAANTFGIHVREAGILANPSIRGWQFSTVLWVSLSGPISVDSSGNVSSQLQVRVTQGEREAPGLARLIQQEIEARIRTASAEAKREILGWLRSHP